jgi:3-oxoacyl-[acyl-carrier-protein] synthase II
MMKLQGIGVLFAGGRGLPALAQAWNGDGYAPTLWPVAEKDVGVPVYAIADEDLAAAGLARQARRADRFCKIALAAARDALHDAGLAEMDESARLRTGLVVGSALGPHVTTFRFLDDILTYGDREVSPTAFSHSVHNAAASYLAATYGLRGPTLTLTDFHFSLPYALLVAQGWLAGGRCDRVLAGTVDELGSVMAFLSRSLLRFPADGRLPSMQFGERPAAVPGEAGVFLALERCAGPGAYGDLSVAVPDPRAAARGVAREVFLDANGLLRDETPYGALRDRLTADGAVCRSAVDRFGSVPSGLSLHVAAAALALQGRLRDTGPVARVDCVKLNGRGQCGRVGLEKENHVGH